MKKTIFYTFAVLLLLGYVVSCSGRDDRDEVRARNGEPDEIQTLGKDQFWRETWFYFGDPTGIAFEFRKNSGCGTLEDVFLFSTYPVIGGPSDSTGATIFLPKSNNPLKPY